MTVSIPKGEATNDDFVSILLKIKYVSIPKGEATNDDFVSILLKIKYVSIPKGEATNMLGLAGGSNQYVFQSPKGRLQTKKRKKLPRYLLSFNPQRGGYKQSNCASVAVISMFQSPKGRLQT